MGTGSQVLAVHGIEMTKTQTGERFEQNVAMVTSIFSPPANHSNHTLLCPLFIAAHNIAKSGDRMKMAC